MTYHALSCFYAIGPLSACLSCLSVTLVHCGQTVRWIKTKLGTQVGRGSGHIVLHGDTPPLPKEAQPAILVHICCGQIAAWIKMPHGMEVGLGPGDFVLDGDLAPPSPKGAPPPPIFGPCLLWPNSWMDEAGTWHGGRAQPRRLCVRWGPRSSSQKRGRSSEIFGPCLLWPNGWMDQNGTWHGGRPQPRRLCVRWGPSPVPKKGRSPQFSPHVYCGQTAAWIKMPLGTEVGLGLRDVVLDGDPAPPPMKGYSPQFSANVRCG